jgi:hypothetical protein
MKTTYRSQSEIKTDIENMPDEDYNRLLASVPYENRLPDHHFVLPEIIATQAQKDEMRAKFEGIEKLLLEHGIEIKVKNWTEYEGATQMLNRIEHDLNYI